MEVNVEDSGIGMVSGVKTTRIAAECGTAMNGDALLCVAVL